MVIFILRYCWGKGCHLTEKHSSCSSWEVRGRWEAQDRPGKEPQIWVPEIRQVWEQCRTRSGEL